MAKSAVDKPELLARVAQHKSLFFRSASAKYGEAVRGTLRIAPPEHRLKALREDYSTMQEMCFGTPPRFDSIILLMGQFDSTGDSQTPHRLVPLVESVKELLKCGFGLKGLRLSAIRQNQQHQS